MSEKTLVPVDQKIVTFYDDELTAVLVEENGHEVVYVPLKPLCDYLGVNWDGQRQRLRRDPVLTEMVQGTVVITAPSPDGRGGGPQEMLSLPLDYLNGWLFGINANRVKKEIRERLITYQRECYRVLADAFLTRPTETAVSSSNATLLQVREMGLAIARMAEEQIEFDNRLTKTEYRLDKAAYAFGDLTKRMGAIEQRMATGEAVTDEQASQISQAVKSIALATPDKNFAKVYGELYRKFGITSYKLLPAKMFAEAMQFLTEWYVSLTGNDVPF